MTLKDTKPPVWRRIQVPADYSFWDFHVAIQDAMGWLDYHLHQFDIFNLRKKRLEIVGIPDDEFISDWEEETLPGWEVPIRRLFTPGIRQATYLYDFGDGWKHTVLFEKSLPKEAGVSYPRCIGGRRKCPPEDCGGTRGYRDFLEAISDPAHEEHEEYLTWVGGSFDPDDFDPGSVKFDDPSWRWQIAFGKR
ncbi:MAG: plasmid pRiA4b ORF-3 family protein [Thermodesulfobacteriota bacterium]